MQQHYPFRKIPLSYHFFELLPQIDPDTLYLHYNRIYGGDVDALNALLASRPELHGWSLEQLILNDMPLVPITERNRIRFFAGSVYNHAYYFDSMSKDSPRQPGGQLGRAIADQYGSFPFFKTIMLDAVDNVLGVGWVWLNSDPTGNLHISISRDNQAPPINLASPLINLDAWEHAYYLRYPTSDRRYAESWFDIADWNKAEQRYQRALLSASSGQSQ